MARLRHILAAWWHKAELLSPLIFLMLVSFLLALLLSGGEDVVRASSLFQSPLPPPPLQEPTATPLPPVASPEPTATPPPTETPVPPLEPVTTALPPEATVAAPAETPPESSPSAPPPEASGEASEAGLTPETPEEPGAPEGSSPLIFNWGVFLNTVIITLAYIWICCGVCGLLGTPLTFVLLYVWGKRRLAQKLEESRETEPTPGRTAS